MKKLLLSVTVALGFTFAFAQQTVPAQNLPLIKSEPQVLNPFTSKSLGKGGTMVSDWYSILNLFDKSPIGASLQGYVSFCMYDTLSKFVDPLGNIGYGWNVGVGHIFDPKDDLIQLSDNPEYQLSKFNSYKIDTLGLRYLYVRQVDNVMDSIGNPIPVVDTVFVVYYKDNAISQQTFTTTGIKYAALDSKWDYAKRFPTGYFTIDTFLLASGANGYFDTTRVNDNNGFENSWTSKISVWPAPANMTVSVSPTGTTVDNLTGYAVIFKAGIAPVVNGDTAVYVYQRDKSQFPITSRRTNYFGYRYATASSKYNGYNARNTTQIMPKGASYAAINGWEAFIAASAFLNSESYLDAFFHLTVTGNIGAGINDNDNSSFGLSKVYPNPASVNGTSRISFLLNNSSDVKVSLFNLVGQEVKSLPAQKFAAGEHEVSIDLNNLKAGVYMFNVTVNGASKSQKLIISE